MPTERKRYDIVIYILLIALGGMQIALSCRTTDFSSDPYYYELARSILARTGYGFNFRPEPMVPPGFPMLLALLIIAAGNSFTVLIRSMPVFTTLGLLTSYELLKSEEGRPFAGVACLLLASSSDMFTFSTGGLFSDMPYFLCSMLFLCAVARLEPALNREWKRGLIWWLLCAFLLVASILLRSTGIALAGAVLVWLTVCLFRKPNLIKRRLAIFMPLVILGFATEGAWMLWAEKHPVSQWPVHGFQESYIAQLKLKNGNNPELGFATWQDVLKRPIENEDDMATAMGALLTHKPVASAWYSPATVIPLALLLAGLAGTIRESGGGIAEWYFVAYQLLFLFWPWNFELRFQLPVAPLAALYIWRGGKHFWLWARVAPRQMGALGLSVAALGILSAAVWGLHTRHPLALTCIAIWSVAGGVCVPMILGRPEWIRRLSLLLKSVVYVRGMGVRRSSIVTVVSITCLLASGVWMQALEGMENLRRTPEMDPSIDAAEWIHEHSEAEDIVMARWEARVYHYSRRRVIWFPPSTDPQLLMAGIRRYHIRLIAVTEDEDDSYWKPSDSHCFNVLMRAYPKLFHQVHQGSHERVYEYDPPAANVLLTSID